MLLSLWLLRLLLWLLFLPRRDDLWWGLQLGKMGMVLASLACRVPRNCHSGCGRCRQAH